MASGTLALQHPSDEDNILDLAQDGSNSGGRVWTARVTSVLMGVVTVVVTMVKDSDEVTELMTREPSDIYFYYYDKLHLIVRSQTILSTMQPTNTSKVKTSWSTKLNALKYSIIYL